MSKSWFKTTWKKPNQASYSMDTLNSITKHAWSQTVLWSALNSLTVYGRKRKRMKSKDLIVILITSMDPKQISVISSAKKWLVNCSKQAFQSFLRIFQLESITLSSSWRSSNPNSMLWMKSWMQKISSAHLMSALFCITSGNLSCLEEVFLIITWQLTVSVFITPTDDQ